MANHPLDMTFERFGRLVAVRLYDKDSRGLWRWLMRCDCGNFTHRSAAKLRSSAAAGKSSSCGCAHHLRTHGLTKSHKKLRWVWSAMKARCTNPANKDFSNYGGRGISVCAEWHDFKVFAAWAESSGYAPGMTIERQDVNGGYDPANCTWILNKRQPRNRTNTHLYTMDGRTMDIRDWAEEYGIPYYRLRSRLLNYGWDLRKALTTPARGAA